MFSSDTLYWIWLSLALGQGSSKITEAIELFGSPKELFSCSRRSLSSSGLFTPGVVDRILSVSLDDAKAVAAKCEKDNQHIICYGDENFPELLRNIYCPPAVLYIKGNLPNFDDEVGITIVGSRKCSSYGYEAAQILSYRLSRAGAIIISGGAQGIDSAAHNGCLDADGKTVAVLPCAINYSYNMANAELRERITEKGALVSEYPPDTGVMRYSFHVRNRLLAAFGRGTVVVEAGEKSGALITANHAAEQGKDIFALPGNLKSPYSVGSNRLIKDGACAVECPLDILEQYAPFYPHKLSLAGTDIPLFAGSEYSPKAQAASKPVRTKSSPEKQEPKAACKPQKKPESIPVNKTEKKLPEGLSEKAITIVKAVGAAKFNTDDISIATGLSAGEILRALTELELFGVAEPLPGGRYIISDTYKL